MWPAFVALTFVDGVVGHLLPPAGTTETLVAATLLGLVVNVIAGGPAVAPARHAAAPRAARHARRRGARLRRHRGRRRGHRAAHGRGLAHRPEIQARQRDTADAIARAQAWIGDRAPDTFRRNLQFVSLLAIVPGTIYRACVPSVDGRRSYCVIVNRDLPFQNSVTFSGYEPNSVLDAGAG